MSAVETRGQKQNKEIKISLKVSELINDVSPEQIKDYQESDETLSEVRQNACTGEIVHCKAGSMVMIWLNMDCIIGSTAVLVKMQRYLSS